MSDPDVVPALVALGFSLNESRAYAALLQESPSTGYEVGVRAQIPRSAVYGVLRRLVKAGAARSIAGTPERFAPSPAEDVVHVLRKRFDASVEQLEAAIARMDTAPSVPDAFSVRGYERILEEAERLVRGAQDRLVLSGWPRELAALVPELKAAVKRKVYVVVFSHAALPPMPGELFSYNLDERDLEEFWKHRLVVVADDRASLVGATERLPTDSAVLSETAAIAEIATSQVALDITLLCQRSERSTEEVMARMLGARVGRLDTLTQRRGVVAGAPSHPPLRSALAVDPYADLLRDTRGLRREQSVQREAWLAGLKVEGKEALLFELEALLKGLACFANPRNHPGNPRRSASVVTSDYHGPTVVVREALARVVALCKVLLGAQERAFVFQRYLETVLPDDGARTRLVRAAQAQDTPEESLFQLRHAMTNLLEVAGGICRLSRVPFRTFFAMLGVAHSEISSSAFFNPLSALEFRPEFDRITNVRLLELTRQVGDERARRLVALTMLAFFRMLKYLDLLETRSASGTVYLVLSVLRSDARALTSHLSKRAGPQLAEGYEALLLRRPANELGARFDRLREEGHRLIQLKAAFGGIAANLRLELRRAFEHELPAPETPTTEAELQVAVRRVIATLRPALQNAILVLGKVLGERLDEHGVFDDAQARRALSERLRRDVWMFAQILRAFGAKARALPDTEERWAGASSLQFVREFLSYFQAMGYPLLRQADYPRFDVFIEALSALRESDLTSPERLDDAVAEAEEFTFFLSDLFERISAREELRDQPFDRRAAAMALRLYLGE